MLIADPKARIPWSPPWAEDEGPYYWVPRTVADRDMLEAELTGVYRAGMVYPQRFHDIVARELAERLPDMPDEAARLTDISARLMAGGDVTDEEGNEFARVRDLLIDTCPDYRRLVDQHARRMEILPTLVFRRHVVGWDKVTDGAGDPVPFKADLERRVTDEALFGLDRLVISVLGSEIYQALYARGAEKNSVPRLPSESGPETLTSETQTDG